MSYFKSAATKIAHNSTIPALAGNRDLKGLQDLILAEKAVLQTSGSSILLFEASLTLSCAFFHI